MQRPLDVWDARGDADELTCGWGRAGCAARHDVESSRVPCPGRRGDAPRARIAHRVRQVSSVSLETQGTYRQHGSTCMRCVSLAEPAAR